jgi:metal-responsive CopG/Arc/MetJ family transcriptional regulator
MTQVTVNLDEELYRKLDKERRETGLSMSMLIQLRLRGKEIRDAKRAG